MLKALLKNYEINCNYTLPQKAYALIFTVEKNLQRPQVNIYATSNSNTLRSGNKFK